MNKFFLYFLLGATIFVGAGCVTIQGGAGFTSHATVEHHHYTEARPMYVLAVPGKPDVTTVHVQRRGGDPRIPREEKVTITEYGTGYFELDEDSPYYNSQAERAAGNTGGRGPSGRRH